MIVLPRRHIHIPQVIPPRYGYGPRTQQPQLRPTMAAHLAIEPVTAKNGEDWKDWKNWSDWPSDYGTWIQEKEESHTDMANELASPEQCCDDGYDSDYEVVVVEEEENHEETIKRTQEVLDRHCSGAGKQWQQQEVLQHHHLEAPFLASSCKRERSPPSKTSRRGRRRKAVSERAKARNAKLNDDKRGIRKMDVRDLRYSQLSCKKSFKCGRSVKALVRDLLSRKVSLSAPFLRLTVFETRDKKTKERMLKCINNRRLLALKQYAVLSGKDKVMVKVNFYNDRTVKDVQRFLWNNDETDGFVVKVRDGKDKKMRR